MNGEKTEKPAGDLDLNPLLPTAGAG